MANISKTKTLFLGKVVRINPSDKFSKTGRIVDINEKGVTFRIVSSQTQDFTIGKLHFVAWAKLTFEAVDSDHTPFA